MNIDENDDNVVDDENPVDIENLQNEVCCKFLKWVKLSQFKVLKCEDYLTVVVVIRNHYIEGLL